MKELHAAPRHPRHPGDAAPAGEDDRDHPGAVVEKFSSDGEPPGGTAHAASSDEPVIGTAARHELHDDGHVTTGSVTKTVGAGHAVAGLAGISDITSPQLGTVDFIDCLRTACAAGPAPAAIVTSFEALAGAGLTAAAVRRPFGAVLLRFVLAYRSQGGVGGLYAEYLAAEQRWVRPETRPLNVGANAIIVALGVSTATIDDAVAHGRTAADASAAQLQTEVSRLVVSTLRKPHTGPDTMTPPALPAVAPPVTWVAL